MYENASIVNYYTVNYCAEEITSFEDLPNPRPCTGHSVRRSGHRWTITS